VCLGRRASMFLRRKQLEIGACLLTVTAIFQTTVFTGSSIWTETDFTATTANQGEFMHQNKQATGNDRFMEAHTQHLHLVVILLPIMQVFCNHQLDTMNQEATLETTMTHSTLRREQTLIIQMNTLKTNQVTMTIPT